MFLIKRWSDDSDWGDSHYVVCLVEKDPNLVMAHLQAKDMYRKLWRDRYFKHQEKWEKENPRPEYFRIKPIPKWKSGTKQKDITPEMRQERDDVKAYNDDVFKKNEELEKTWANLLYTEMDRWMQEVGFPKELSENVASSYTNYNSEYSFEEIEISELIDGQLVPIKG